MKTNRRDFLLTSASTLLLAQNALPASAQTKRPPVDRKPISLEGKEITVYTTAEKSDHRLSVTDKLKFKPHGQPLETQICVFVDPSKTFQTFLGIGGALTDARAETFAKMPAAKQQEIIDAYFDARTKVSAIHWRGPTIHSCDFSSASYTYVAEGDKELKSFSVNHDKQFRIAFNQKSDRSGRRKTNIFASPWSPPAFMKDNNKCSTAEN